MVRSSGKKESRFPNSHYFTWGLPSQVCPGPASSQDALSIKTCQRCRKLVQAITTLPWANCTPAFYLNACLCQHWDISELLLMRSELKFSLPKPRLLGLTQLAFHCCYLSRPDSWFSLPTFHLSPVLQFLPPHLSLHPFESWFKPWQSCPRPYYMVFERACLWRMNKECFYVRQTQDVN